MPDFEGMAQEQVDLIRSACNRTPSGEALPLDALSYIYEQGWFKLFVPAELGGRMTPLPEAARIFEQAARVDGSFGWCVTIGAGGGFFSATLPEPAAKELFRDPKAVIAGSGHPTGIARPVDGGYAVSGQWKYCSGSSYATFYTANCIVERETSVPVPVAPHSEDEMRSPDPAAGGKMDESESLPEIRSFVFLPEQVEIIRDWNAFGLKATESHTIRVQEAFVPEGLTFDIFTEPRYTDPIFRYPFLPFAQISFAAVVLGIGCRFLEESREVADFRRKDWNRGAEGRSIAVDEAIVSAEQSLKDSGAAFHRIVEQSWSEFEANGMLSEAMVNGLTQHSQAAAREAVRAANTVFPLLGMAALMEDQPVNRVWRDLHAAAQHSVLTSPSV